MKNPTVLVLFRPPQHDAGIGSRHNPHPVLWRLPPHPGVSCRHKQKQGNGAFATSPGCLSTQQSNKVSSRRLSPYWYCVVLRGNSLRRGRVYPLFILHPPRLSLTTSLTPSRVSQSAKVATEKSNLTALQDKLAKEQTERVAEARRAVSRSPLHSIASLKCDTRPHQLARSRNS